MNLVQLFLTPIQALKLKYVPLLLIYFAYGASSFSAIAANFWVKTNLEISAVELAELGVWLTLPWTIKMIFGQMVDSVKIFGSNRTIYVYIGAVLLFLSLGLMVLVVGNYPIIKDYNPQTIYVLSSILAVIGYVMQDVVADTMSTEVVDRTKSDDEIKQELASVQLLSRLTLGLAVFITTWLGGELASIFKDDYSPIFILALFFPLLSIIGVSFIKLPTTKTTPLNKLVLFTGFGFALFVVLMGYNDISYSQEIVFIISLAVVLFLLRDIIKDLAPDTIRHIKRAMLIIFIYRATPSIGAGASWWQIDILGFDEAFFAKLGAIGGGIALLGIWFGAKLIIKQDIAKVLIFLIIIGTILSLPTLGMYYDLHSFIGVDARTIALIDTALSSPFDYISMVLMLTLIAIYAPEGKRGTWFALMASLMNIALTASGLLTKYLNKIFIITREVVENGEVIVPSDYSQLGYLIISVILISFIVPLVIILKFNPNK
jgi:MFS family permease